jgi:large subunit ribosomal protein L31e
MAETKEIKREYNIPLRSYFSKKPKYRRAKVAIKGVISFLKKHMKSEQIKIGPVLNLEIWKHGIKNPPHHIKVVATKDKEGVVKAEMFGHEYVEAKKEEKKQSIKDRMMEKMGGSQQTVVKKVKEEKAETKTEAKPEVKEETPKAEVKKEEKPVEKKPEAEPVKTEKPAEAPKTSDKQE